MSLLDAVPCVWSNCYSNDLAKSIGIALNSDNKLITYDGVYWKYNNSYVFKKYNSGRYTSNAIVAEYASGYSSFANVYYDSNTQVLAYNSANNYCVGLGMRLPTREETSAKNINGIPSSPSGATWTSTSCGYNWQCQWSGTQEDGFDAYVGYAHFLRCVISE